MAHLTNQITNPRARFPHRLGVFGHVPHWTGPDGAPWAYEPYVREMRVWAELFSSVEVFSPIGEGPMSGNLAPYQKDNICWNRVPYSLAYGYAGALRRLCRLPGMAWRARRMISRNDFILLRSPGHVGLVGAALVRLMKRPSLTKWAGENNRYDGERLPSRLDRRLQSVPSGLHPVLVYGPPKFPHQISFLPALMHDEELARARHLSFRKDWQTAWEILSVGRLEEVKNFALALRGLAELNRIAPELSWRYTLIGDGTIKGELQKLARECGIADRVRFTGALQFGEVQNYYATAHVALMPGVKEGWPKIIAEGWAHGAFPVAAEAGIVPWILRDEDAGAIFRPSPEALAAVLAELFRAPARLRERSRSLFRYAERMSLDNFKSQLEQVLVERCGLS